MSDPQVFIPKNVEPEVAIENYFNSLPADRPPTAEETITCLKGIQDDCEDGFVYVHLFGTVTPPVEVFEEAWKAGFTNVSNASFVNMFATRIPVPLFEWAISKALEQGFKEHDLFRLLFTKVSDPSAEMVQYILDLVDVTAEKYEHNCPFTRMCIMCPSKELIEVFVNHRAFEDPKSLCRPCVSCQENPNSAYYNLCKNDVDFELIRLLHEKNVNPLQCPVIPGNNKVDITLGEIFRCTSAPMIMPYIIGNDFDLAIHHNARTKKRTLLQLGALSGASVTTMDIIMASFKVRPRYTLARNRDSYKKTAFDYVLSNYRIGTNEVLFQILTKGFKATDRNPLKTVLETLLQCRNQAQITVMVERLEILLNNKIGETEGTFDPRFMHDFLRSKLRHVVPAEAGIKFVRLFFTKGCNYGAPVIYKTSGYHIWSGYRPLLAVYNKAKGDEEKIDDDELRHAEEQLRKVIAATTRVDLDRNEARFGREADEAQMFDGALYGDGLVADRVLRMLMGDPEPVEGEEE